MNDNLDQIGQAADRIDDLLMAATMPLPPQAHLNCFLPALREIRDQIRAAVVAETGENPWEE